VSDRRIGAYIIDVDDASLVARYTPPQRVVMGLRPEPIILADWSSVPTLLKDHDRDEERQWTPERESIAALMGSEDERPSGISGIDPAYFATKAELIRRSRKVTELEIPAR